MNNSINPSKQVLPWLTALAMFMQALDGTILNTALPTIAVDFNQSSLEMQSVIVSYTITLAILIPLSGWLADKFGTKNIFSLSVIVFTIGSVLCAFSYNLPQLIGSRVIQAIGGAMMVPVARLAILYTYPKSQLLQVMNFVTIPGLVGQVIGPTLGGFLSDNYSWHWVFLINIPIGIIGVYLSQKKMPNFSKPVQKFDIVGLLYISIFIVSLTIIMELLSIGLTQWMILLLTALLSLISVLLYVKHSKKTQKPIINLNLFKVDTLRIGLLGNLFTRLGVGGMPLMLPLMLQVGYGHSASLAGLLLIPAALANVFAKSLVVPLVKKYGYRNILIVNTLVLGITIASFSLTNSTTPLMYFIPLLVIFGAANSIQMSSMNTITISDLSNETASDGNSLLAIMQQLSNSFGVSIAALILSLMKNVINEENNISLAFTYTFIVIGLITAVSAYIFTRFDKNAGSDLSGHIEK